MLKSMLTHVRETRMREFEGDEGAEAGFTLIELMVVLLIIAILLAIAIPTFLGVANSAGDRAAQSNLTNALTEAKAIYQNSASYASGGAVLPIGTFTASAPEFSWVQGNNGTAGGCFTGTNANCVSEQVVDASTVGDSQGIVLAVYSPKTQSCWYAVDLESAPAVFTDTSPAVSFSSAAHTQSGASTAGVFYALKKTGVTVTNCNAGYPSQGPASFAWGQSYSSPGAAG